VSGRGKLGGDMREIWMMQPRFDKRTGSTPYSLVEQARFRAAFDFMRLRADVGEVSEAIAEWWQEFSTSDDTRRSDLLEQVREEQKVRQRVRVRETPQPPKPRAEPAGRRATDAGRSGEGDEVETVAVPPDGEAVVPRKRRRRRKPRTGGGGEGGGSAAGA
jgi:poly(A) polymerase